MAEYCSALIYHLEGHTFTNPTPYVEVLISLYPECHKTVVVTFSSCLAFVLSILLVLISYFLHLLGSKLILA